MFIPDGIVAIKNRDSQGAIVIRRGTSEKYSIDEDMILLLKHINNHPLDTHNDIEKTFGIGNCVLENLQSLNIIRDGVKEPSHFYKGPKDFDHLNIEITTRCNLYCKHCCYGCGNVGTDMPMDVFRSIIDVCISEEIPHITITGGEPMLHPDLREMLDIADESNIAVTLFTNLTRYDISILSEIRNHRVHKVVTSIESYDSKTHDAFRRMDGAHRKTTDGIERLVEHGVPVEVNLVIGPHNCKMIDDTISFIKGLGARCKIDVISPFGRASNNDIDYQTIISELRRHNYKPDYSCGICSGMLFISADGTTHICPSIREPDYSLGCLTDPDFSLTECKTKYNQIGLSQKDYPGCRARALNMSGNIRNEDPIYRELSR